MNSRSWSAPRGYQNARFDSTATSAVLHFILFVIFQNTQTPIRWRIQTEAFSSSLIILVSMFQCITPHLCVIHCFHKWGSGEWRPRVSVHATPIGRAFHAAASIAHAWCTWMYLHTYTQRDEGDESDETDGRAVRWRRQASSAEIDNPGGIGVRVHPPMAGDGTGGRKKNGRKRKT